MVLENTHDDEALAQRLSGWIIKSGRAHTLNPAALTRIKAQEILAPNGTLRQDFGLMPDTALALQQMLLTAGKETCGPCVAKRLALAIQLIARNPQCFGLQAKRNGRLYSISAATAG
ncbi:MAG: hypothetical protein EBZ69_03210 [Alphaproteobacteria bacterium]|nr:hypothetical protein [Alphaproteobacteria bacterium]